ncbi:MAG: PAS domain S-box protein [Planctomycetes bacterium]|nr:PAS domain S-box protein [Planctomycetota bacterium]
MKEEKSKPDKVDGPQHRTEESLSKKKTQKAQDMAGMETYALAHEQQTHQTKLEMQNEEPKHAHAEAEDALNKYTELYDFAPVGYFTLDKHGILIEANLAGASLLGVERSSLINRYFHLFIKPEYLPAFNTFRNKMVETDTKQTCEIELVKTNASTVCVRLEGIVTAGGKGKQFRVAAIDITAQRHANEEIYLLQTITFALNVSENLHDALVIALHKICNFTGWVYGEAWRSGSDGEFLERDHAYYSAIEGLEKFIAYTEGLTFAKGSGLPGRAWAEKQPVWVQNATLEPTCLCASFAREAGLKTGIAFPIITNNEVVAVIVFYHVKVEERNERLIKLILSVLSQIGSIFNRIKAEETLRRSEAYLDITGIRKTEKLLRESEEKYRSLVESVPYGLQENDLSGTITYSNKAHHAILGYPQGELVGKKIWDLPAYDTDKEMLKAYFMKLVNDQPEPTPYFGKNLTKDGRLVDVQVHWTYKRDEQGRLAGFVSVITDITERKRMEEALQRNEEKFRQLAEYVQECFWITSSDIHEIIYVSPAYEKIWGRTCKSLYENPEDWINAVHPDDHVRIQASFLELMKHGNFNEEYRIARPDGTIRWIYDRAFPIKDKSGNVCRVVGIAEDITERKRMESEHQKLREQLYHAQNLASVGKLAGGVAHNFNNLLTVIMGYASILLTEIREKDPLRDYVQRILKSSETAASLTQDLLAFSREQPICPEPVNLNEIVIESQTLLAKLIREDIKLEVMLSARNCIVMVDSCQIVNVLMNLATNARDAMPKGGLLTINTDVVEMDKTFVKARGYGEVGEYALISVSDTGMGMDEDTKSRIFEPFFTTKEVGKGMGLGLASVYGIVKQHNGYIEVDSAPGKGTTFKIYLPLIESKDEQAITEVNASASRDGTETILLLEKVRNILDKPRA